MRSVVAYTAARLLLFAVAFGVLYLLGARGLLAAALAVLISGMVSYVLLARQRDAVSAVIAGGIANMRGIGDRLEAGAAKEDAAQAAARSEAAESAAGGPKDGTEGGAAGQERAEKESGEGADGPREESGEGAAATAAPSAPGSTAER
ncbi:DUF4229 domain-containing protein [Streptomonospora nanhaiensis]|uniref:Outer membrane murein-binding lipoprotein Lpp n=1 Tax=Streptomonospora nanhaiensis TaxID=1323731 RepID=A0A853BNQ6_9ACTN|nr:DUF4229 domain-containing protein [Streptomonospora nanhaiensis]MBV2361788.1 DUF4229 domain-containing protein [Streptomonospora nanhaiensis]MBX9388000.1 DUF4229 domain-containing protein [Streptomonospora nanhaiensis]NYI96394.1 outer membrane murein-binding lipoprotein Lpp [Streptomonospora nanhaiensis]